MWLQDCQLLDCTLCKSIIITTTANDDNKNNNKSITNDKSNTNNNNNKSNTRTKLQSPSPVVFIIARAFHEIWCFSKKQNNKNTTKCTGKNHERQIQLLRRKAKENIIWNVKTFFSLKGSSCSGWELEKVWRGREEKQIPASSASTSPCALPFHHCIKSRKRFIEDEKKAFEGERWMSRRCWKVEGGKNVPENGP